MLLSTVLGSTLAEYLTSIKGGKPNPEESVPGPAAGGLFRQLVPSDDAGCGADLHAASGRARCRRVSLGYHGISYDYISRQVPKFAPQARCVIAAHLGGGASMCAMLNGRSVETTMGFAAVSGLPMATRLPPATHPSIVA